MAFMSVHYRHKPIASYTTDNILLSHKLYSLSNIKLFLCFTYTKHSDTQCISFIIVLSTAVATGYQDGCKL